MNLNTPQRPTLTFLKVKILHKYYADVIIF